ncbi:MAG: hypothetical protein JSS66_17695 [Armatimonadetes bacterium]|nr:hypothetical protein [Armatimonadota bacterium]
MADHWFSAFLTLFRETFEGIPPGQNYTIFVQGKEGIFDVFDSVDAARASAKPNEDCASIFAHMNHARYYLSLWNASARGEEVEGDWAGSWKTQSGDEAAWAALARDFRSEYQEFIGHVQAMPATNEDKALGRLAQLAHAAFHLGAVRALMKVV